MAVPLTDDPDLHLMVDGQRIDVASQNGEFHVFALAGRPAAALIVSRTGVPQELGLARDPRCLGVALRQIMVRQGVRFCTAGASDALLRQGFHAFEADNDLRWTDGEAVVPTALLDRFTGPLEIVVRLAGTTRYVDRGTVSRVA
jgi:hypothetical protein